MGSREQLIGESALQIQATKPRNFPQQPQLRLFNARCGRYNSAERGYSVTKLAIAVGSIRKPKVAAVHEAVQTIASTLATDVEFEILGVEVESGVNHTPLSREESMRGARQRAESLEKLAKQEAKPWNYFVGLEGGLDSVSGNGDRRVFLESWAYVSDGSVGHFGRSGAIELPEALTEEVFLRGTELSVAIDQFAGQAGIRDAQGAWGVLSGNKITRQEAFRVALIAAFAPFFNQDIYSKRAVAG